MSAKKESRMRYVGGELWTPWRDHNPGDTFQMDLDKYDSVEYRNKPTTCVAYAPFEIEGYGRPVCESLDDQACASTGSHSYELEVGSGQDMWSDCYYIRQITWSANG